MVVVSVAVAGGAIVVIVVADIHVVVSVEAIAVLAVWLL